MRFSLSALAFAASLAFVSAQDLTGIPDCALTCFATAVPASGCSLTDTKCQCTTGQSKIQDSITACVPSKCSAADIAKLAPAVEAICQRAGVTISNVPTAISSGSSNSSASRTASATGSRGASGSSSGQPAQNTGGAAANIVGMGAVAMGLAAGVFGL